MPVEQQQAGPLWAVYLWYCMERDVLCTPLNLSGAWICCCPSFSFGSAARQDNLMPGPVGGRDVAMSYIVLHFLLAAMQLCMDCMRCRVLSIERE